jgi:farnesyl-diphosphate farnesyltransferase
MEKLLNAHARTFALTLRLLPPSLREPLGLTYLLARASDTIADTVGMAQERRIALLEGIRANLNKGGGMLQPDIRPGELSLAETTLIAAVPELMEVLTRHSDGEAMLRLWGTILEGQLFDLWRFAPGAAPLSREELERYCWLVAGSVGEAWTELIVKRHPEILRRPSAAQGQLKLLGGGYGKGLQLINILRDRAADRLLGRVYAQEGEFQELLDLAEKWLDQGEHYLTLLHPGRILYATRLPWELARRTLARIRKEPGAPRVKMSRYEVYKVLLFTLPSLGLPGGSNPAS